MRLFIAVELPEKVKNNIGGLIEKLSADESQIKWVKPQNLHITLKFLGWVPDERLEEIIKKTKEALCGRKSFKVLFLGAGTFPGGKHPRVFWVGITEGAEELSQIAKSLDQEFSPLGFKTEKRDFSPHITIGRVKSQGARVTGIENSKDKYFGEMMVDHVSIVKSTLTPKGSIYEVIISIGFKSLKSPRCLPK